DLAYGADFLSPIAYGIRLGASALTYRTLGATVYNQRDVFASRVQVAWSNLDAYGEYANSETYKQVGLSTGFGSAIYANADYNLGKLQLGAAYKKYEDFQYRLHDLATANYHSETLSDALATGLDEEGWQARGTLSITSSLSLYADYAEAWDSPKTKQMNDLYTSLDWIVDSTTMGIAYSQVEKADDVNRYWQKESTPALSFGLPVFGKPVFVKADFMISEKQIYAVTGKHYEPKIQSDLSIGKLAISLGAQSNWADFEAVIDSRYWAFMEAKYPIASHSDLVIFGGKEAGGKVCRNGVCRYVSAFEGLKVELSTRF
ncbi:MAG: hypothetical protein PHY48_09605, partial [Candidatus Cloacimonetes bacterium]|nr:hypothetical protein [Candidatus Cloacimonadota bacterium]